MKNITDNTIYTVQELHTFYDHLKLHYQSFHFHQYFHYSLHSLSISFFLYLQFSKSKYSPTSHDLSHSHLQLLGFQINLLSHPFLSINSLHSHLHLSLFQRCLSLQKLTSNLPLHLQVLCHFIRHVSLVLDIRLNT